MQLGQGSAQFHFLSREEDTSSISLFTTNALHRVFHDFLQFFCTAWKHSGKFGQQRHCSHADFVVAQNVTHQLTLMLTVVTPVLNTAHLRGSKAKKNYCIAKAESAPLSDGQGKRNTLLWWAR